MTDTYCPWCPWDSVNYFDQAELMRQLDPQGQFGPRQESDAQSKVSWDKKTPNVKMPGKRKKSHLLTGGELTQPAKDLLAASNSKR